MYYDLFVVIIVKRSIEDVIDMKQWIDFSIRQYNYFRDKLRQSLGIQIRCTGRCLCGQVFVEDLQYLGGEKRGRDKFYFQLGLEFSFFFRRNVDEGLEVLVLFFVWVVWQFCNFQFVIFLFCFFICVVGIVIGKYEGDYGRCFRLGFLGGEFETRIFVKVKKGFYILQYNII